MPSDTCLWQTLNRRRGAAGVRQGWLSGRGRGVLASPSLSLRLEREPSGFAELSCFPVMWFGGHRIQIHRVPSSSVWQPRGIRVDRINESQAVRVTLTMRNNPLENLNIIIKNPSAFRQPYGNSGVRGQSAVRADVLHRRAF